jgi:PhoPQ-activated pathogenicity-related protein
VNRGQRQCASRPLAPTRRANPPSQCYRMFDVSFSEVSSSNRMLILGAGLLLTTLLPTSESLANALETYVRKPDASCAWKRTEQKRIRDATVTHLKFTSQTLRGHLWRHDLLVLRPTSVRRADTAMLFITGDTYTAPNQLETDRFHEVAQGAPARS